jgi:hypothetical protein
MIRRSATSNPAALGLQIESATTQLTQLLRWFQDGTLNFEELNKAYGARQPDIEKLVRALSAAAEFPETCSGDLAMAGAPLMEGEAVTQLSLMIERLRELAKCLPHA